MKHTNDSKTDGDDHTTVSLESDKSKTSGGGGCCGGKS